MLRYLVITRLGDPLLRLGRARMIWACGTASATAKLGFNISLVGSPMGFPFKLETRDALLSARDLLARLYNVESNFDLMPLYPAPSSLIKKKEYLVNERWELGYDLKRYILSQADLVHTRDNRVVEACMERNIPVIFEDHNEDYHTSVETFNTNYMNCDCLKAVVAITERVRERLIAKGMPEHKIIVLPSGVNECSENRYPEESKQWRKKLLGTRFEKLIVYTGGLHVERDIHNVLHLARARQDCCFAIVGGAQRDIDKMVSVMQRTGINNIKMFGFVGQRLVIELQQAADLLLLTRAAGLDSLISSPLKFYEYLFAGRPILSAAMPEIKSTLTGTDHQVHFYEPGDLTSLKSKFDSALQSATEWIAEAPVISANFNRQFTWFERQKKLFNFAGMQTRID